MAAHRTPLVSVQCVRRNAGVWDDAKQKIVPGHEWLINVEVNQVPAFTLGPYDYEITLVDALSLVAADLRLSERLGDYKYAAAHLPPS